MKLLRPKKRLGFGYAANEAALFHKESKTLALTDALIYIPPTPTPAYDKAGSSPFRLPLPLPLPLPRTFPSFLLASLSPYFFPSPSGPFTGGVGAQITT